MKRALFLFVVIAAIVGVVALKMSRRSCTDPLPAHRPGLPRLLDLGSKGCTACTLLEPVLEELRTRYSNRLQVDFIDVFENKGVAEQYGIEIIPVQIFYTADGREFFRHQGFISADEVVAKFTENGIVLDAD